MIIIVNVIRSTIPVDGLTEGRKKTEVFGIRVDQNEPSGS